MVSRLSSISIPDSIRNRFNEVHWMDEDELAEHKQTRTYDSWEPYSDTKTYHKEQYTANYAGVDRDYTDVLYAIVTDNKPIYYVAAERTWSESNFTYPECSCVRCQAAFYNPIKFLGCPHCLQCKRARGELGRLKYLVTNFHLPLSVVLALIVAMLVLAHRFL